MKIAILGSNGFLGRSLAKRAKDNNHLVYKFARGEFPKKGEEFDLLIDATSQYSRSDVHDYLDCLKKFNDLAKISKIVTLQSFSTITEKVSNEDCINFGISPKFKTPYSCIKLYKEKALVASKLNSNIQFIYLPLILGRNGIWDKHSKSLSKLSNPKVQEINVYYTTIEHIFDNVLSNDSVRRLVYISKKPLHELLSLELEKINLTYFKYSKKIDSVFLLSFYLFKFKPIIPHAMDYLLSKLVGSSFPSFFYWYLFKEQSKISFKS